MGPGCWGVWLAWLWGPQPPEESLPRGQDSQDGPHKHSLPSGKAIKSNTFQPQSVTCATSQNPEKNRDNLGEARPSGGAGQEGAPLGCNVGWA